MFIPCRMEGDALVSGWMLQLQGGDFRPAVFSRSGSGRGSDWGMAVTPIAIAIANTDWDGGRRETRQGQPGHPEEDFRPSLDNTLVPCRAGRRDPVADRCAMRSELSSHSGLRKRPTQ